MESSDKMWSTGGGNGRPFQYSESHENPMNGINGKRKDVININYNLYLGLSLSLSLFSQLSITSLLKHIKENTAEKNIKVLSVSP